MKFGVTIPNNWGVSDPRAVASMGVLAESLGYGSIWVGDHLLQVGYIGDRLGNKPYHHPLSLLSYLSAKTSRIKLGTSALVLPFRNPVDLAKYVATLDQLSEGRLVLGVGVGNLADEFTALGIPFGDRGVVTDEVLAVMTELWTNEEATFKGERWAFSEVKFPPKPLQQPHPPLWTGGTAKAALRCAALFGDGWHPTGLSPSDFSRGCDQVREMAAAKGRATELMTMSVRVQVDFGEDQGPRAGGPDILPPRDLEVFASIVASYVDAGAEHIVFSLDSGNIDRLSESMQEIAQAVLPLLR